MRCARVPAQQLRWRTEDGQQWRERRASAAMVCKPRLVLVARTCQQTFRILVPAKRTTGQLYQSDTVHSLLFNFKLRQAVSQLFYFTKRLSRILPTPHCCSVNLNAMLLKSKQDKSQCYSGRGSLVVLKGQCDRKAHVHHPKDQHWLNAWHSTFGVELGGWGYSTIHEI